MNTRSKEAGYKVFVTKLVAKIFRSEFQEFPKMTPRSHQDTTKRAFERRTSKPSKMTTV